MRPKSIALAPVGTPARATDPTDPEAIVRVLFEKSPLLVYIVDLDFKIVLINRALRDVTGYDTSDCRDIAALLERFYPDPEYRRLVAAIHKGWAENEHIRDTELVCTTKGGAQRTVSWSTSRLRVGRGATCGYIAIGVDVTTRRNLQQWVALFQRSLQHLEEGVVLTDPSGSVLAWSSGAQKLLGHTDESMQGRPLKDLYLRGERELISRTVDRAIETQGHYAGEIEMEHADGSNRILVFKQHRLDGDAGALARLTLLSEPRLDEELQARVADGHAAADDLRAQVEQLRDRLSERDLLVADLEESSRLATAAAAEAQAQKAEVEAYVASIDADSDQVRGRAAELERALAEAVAAGRQAAARASEIERALAVAGAAERQATERAQDLERALAAADASGRQAASRAADIERALAATDAAGRQAAARSGDLERALAEALASERLVSARVDELERALSATDAVARQARAQAAQLEEDLQSAGGDLAEAGSRIAALEDQLASARSDVTRARAEASHRIDEAAVQLALAQAQAADVSDELREARRELDALAARAAGAEQQVVGLEADLENLADQTGQVETLAASQIEDARLALEEARDKLTRAVAAAEEAGARAARFEAELASSRQQERTAAEALESGRRQADAEVAEVEAELERVSQQSRARVAELEAEIAEVRRQGEAAVAAKETQIEAIRRDSGDLAAERELAERIRQELDDVRRHADSRIAEMDVQLAQARRQAEALPAAQARIAELEEASADAAARLADREAAATLGESRSAELAAGLERARGEAEARLAAATEEARAEAHRLQESSAQARKEAEAQAATLQAELDELRRRSAEDLARAEAALAEARATFAPGGDAAASAGSDDGRVDEPTDEGAAPRPDPRIADLEQALAEARQQAAAREDALEKALAEARQQAAAREDALEKALAAKGVPEEAAQALQRAEKRCADLQEELDRLRESGPTTVTETLGADGPDPRVAALEVKLAEAKRQAAAGVADLATKLARAQGECRKLRDALQKAEASPRPESEMEALLALAEQEAGEARRAAARVPELEARVAELESTSRPEPAPAPEPRAGETEAEIAALKLRAQDLQERVTVTESALASAEALAASEADGRARLQERLASTDQEMARVRSELDLARSQAEEMATLDREASAAARKVAELEELLRRTHEEADLAATEASDRWGREREALQKQHRQELADLQERAIQERRALEEQLSRDILAAEERAESELRKTLDRHGKERKEWEDAAEIARAEADSRLRHEAGRLADELRASSRLQPCLGKVRPAALVVADCDGRVIGWTGGTSDLDSRDEVEALGTFLHRDVLRLDGLDPQAVLDGAAESGVFEWEGTLLARGAVRRPVRLVATCVRDDDGQPLGLLEVLDGGAVDASIETHAMAAVARLAEPLHRALEARAISGLTGGQRTAAAVRDLLLVCRSVNEGESWEDVEGAARRVDLGDLVDVSERLVREAEDSWRELRATVKDLLWIEEVVKGGDGSQQRWNELVSRCLHAVEASTDRKARRSFGNQAFVHGRGDRIVPLLVTLLSPIRDATGEVEVTTAASDGMAQVQVSGITMRAGERSLAARFAASAGGSLEVDSGIVALEIPLEAAPAVPLAAGPADDDVALIALGPDDAIVDMDQTVPPSPGPGARAAAAGRTQPAPSRPATTGEPGRDPEPLPDACSVSLGEEADRQTQPGMPSLPPGSGAVPRAGTVDVIGEPGEEAMVLMAGRDPIVASGSDLRDLIGPEDRSMSDLPDIDELEQLFDAAVGVSPSVLATAGEMESYAAATTEQSDELADSAAAGTRSAIPPSADVKTDAGALPAARSGSGPAGPAARAQGEVELPEEASQTDAGGRMGRAPGPDGGGKGHSGKRRGGSRSRRNR